MADSITFTLAVVSFPAKVEKATETAVTEGMRNLCVGQPNKPAHDPVPVTMPKVCADCGPIVDYSALVKGIKQGTTYAITTQEAVAEAKSDASAAFYRKVNLVAHDAQDYEADTAPSGKLYYVTPAAGSEDQYQLAVAYIAAHPELSFVTKYTPRSAAGEYRIVVRHGVLVMEERVNGQKLKATPQVGGAANQQFLQMLEMSTPMIVTPYDRSAYEDEYVKKVAALAAAATDTVNLSKGATAEAPTVVQSDADLSAKLAALAAQATAAAVA